MQYIYSSPPIAKLIDKWDCCGGMTFVFEKIKPAKKEKKRMFGRKNAMIRALRCLVDAKNTTIAYNNKILEARRKANMEMAIKIEELEETITRLKNDALVDSKALDRLTSENTSLKGQNNIFKHSNEILIRDFERYREQYHMALDTNIELNRKAVALDEENKKLKKDIAELKSVNAKMMRAFPCSYGINSFDCFNCRCGGLKDDARG